MRRTALAVVAVALFLPALPAGAADTDPSIVLFHEANCPDCTFIKGALDELLADFPGVVLMEFEVSQPGNLEILDGLLASYGVDLGPVPILFVGRTAFVHAGEDDLPALRAAVEHCATAACPSPLPSPEVSARGDLLILVAFAVLFAVLYVFQGR
ncbi:MAG: hypothetical protein JSW65_07000 [Candidatus Bipolaricaulota bacterium]|nr:MAG: hypothetical protein JSW65_07000 [Candidatus Bipolaricaulota bacterium]